MKNLNVEAFNIVLTKEYRFKFAKWPHTCTILFDFVVFVHIEIDQQPVDCSRTSLPNLKLRVHI
jgi:hypothetical protein